MIKCVSSPPAPQTILTSTLVFGAVWTLPCVLHRGMLDGRLLQALRCINLIPFLPLFSQLWFPISRFPVSLGLKLSSDFLYTNRTLRVTAPTECCREWPKSHLSCHTKFIWRISTGHFLIACKYQGMKMKSCMYSQTSSACLPFHLYLLSTSFAQASLFILLRRQH